MRCYEFVVNNVTRLLNSVEQGDPKAAEELLPLVYGELRKLAAVKMKQQPDGQTLQATALVHEAWLRMVDAPNRPYANRRHFFSAAAQAMRHLLIERARRKVRERHGAGLQRVDIEDVELIAPADDERLIQINTALEKLAQQAPEKAEVVKLRFFVGLDEKEIAGLLNLSPRTVERYWSYAKAWLFEEIPKN